MHLWQRRVGEEEGVDVFKLRTPNLCTSDGINDSSEFNRRTSDGTIGFRRDTTRLSDHNLTTSGDTANEATTAERTEQATTSGDTADKITTDRRTGLFNDGVNPFDQIR